MVTRRQRPRRAQTSQIESIVLQGMTQISSLDEMIVQMLIDAYTRSSAVLTSEIALIESQIRLAMNSAPEPITDAWLRRQRWYNELLDSVNGEIDRYTNTVRNLTAEVERIAARTGVAQSTRLGTEIGIDRVDTPVIERYIAALQPGSPLLESLAKWAQDERKIIERAIADGIIQGQGSRTVSNVIQAQLGEAFDPYKATRIVRTEMMRAYRGAASDQLDAFPDDVIIGYRRIAGLDERTCSVCVILHNHISPTPHDDFHVMCRCIDVPVFSEDYVAAPEGAYMTGEQWLSNQPEETQRRILGKARYEQWKMDGDSLIDMIEYRPNAKWGGTSVMKPLAKVKTPTSVPSAPVAPSPPAFTPAKSIKDAEEFARGLGVKNVKYGDKSQIDVANMVNEGLADLRSRGATMPQTVGVGKFPRKSQRGIVAQYSAKDDSLLWNPKNPMWNNIDGVVKKQYDSGFFSSDNPAHMIRHEMGHALDAKKNPQWFDTDPFNFQRRKSAWLADDYADVAYLNGYIRRHVSGYSLRQNDEFIAEVFAGRMDGIDYPDDILRWYREMNGPEINFPKPTKSTPWGDR